MLDENKNVTEASASVGYESVSQFIRDYRKMFGSAPKEDILNIGQHLKKQKMDIDIYFTISDENGLPRAYRRYGRRVGTKQNYK